MSISLSRVIIVGFIFSLMISPHTVLGNFIAPTIETGLENNSNQVPRNISNLILKSDFNGSVVLPIGEKVLFQAYYWDPHNLMVPDNGEWWKAVMARVPELADAGFDSFWLPPPQKTRLDNIASMGYEPYDYFDLGEFYQKNRTRTRYGTRTELQELIRLMNQYGIAAIADVVINHNNGGKDEYNPFVGHMTPTDFMDVASGRFPRNYTAFWPNQYGQGDALAFGTFPDLCHRNPYVHDGLIEWGKWLRDVIGFDGWRFDVAVGIEPFMLRDWMKEVGNWGVAEYWILHDPALPLYTFDKQLAYLDATNNSLNAFDFEHRLLLREMANDNGKFDMRLLNSSGLIWANRSSQAVTVVSNHDTGRDDRVSIVTNKHLAYAYILTHQGYPSVYWSDFYDFRLGPHILNLVKIHNKYAKGSTTILYSDPDVYVAQRNGNPGLIIGLNDNPNETYSVTVKTKWRDTYLTDFTNQIDNVYVSPDGYARITIPPASYVVLAEGEPFYDFVFKNPYLNESIYEFSKVIPEGIVSVDGKFSREWWGLPMLTDIYGDASRKQRDLESLYLKHDNEYLYLGIKYGTILENEEPLQLGISISVRMGGATTDPYGHSEIHYLASSQKPEYVYYFDTNASDPWRDFYKGTFFAYDSDSGEWSDGVDISKDRFSSDPVIGFMEFKIPLSEIDLDRGGELSLKLFTTAEGKVAAFDSLPNDITIRGTGDDPSWIAMSPPLKIIVDFNETTTSVKTSSSKAGFLAFNFGEVLLPLVTFYLIVVRKKREVSK